MIIEDLGEILTVHDVLFADDLTAAKSAIIGFAKELGRMHRHTYGQHNLFKQFTGDREAFEVDGATNIANQRENLLASLVGMSVEVRDTFEVEVDELYERLFGDQAFYTLIHGDAGVHNVLALGDDLFRLVDFEFARFANGFIDLASIRLGFPPAFHARRTPTDIVHAAEQAYRKEIIKIEPQAKDDEWFEQMLLDACTHWCLVWMKNIWLFYLSKRLEVGPVFDTQEGREAEVMSYFRNKHFTFLEVTLEIAQRRKAQSAVHQALADWKTQFVDYFPDVKKIDFFPAFEQ